MNDSLPIESDWVDYLKAEKHFDSYNGNCDCYYCKGVRDGYSIWKAKQKENREGK